MNMHKNARLKPKGRDLLIARLERGERPGDVACAMGAASVPFTSGARGIAKRGWQGQQDLNPRPTVLETVALPTELYPYAALNYAKWWRFTRG